MPFVHEKERITELNESPQKKEESTDAAMINTGILNLHHRIFTYFYEDGSGCSGTRRDMKCRAKREMNVSRTYLAKE
jgi:hypothetical protein